MFEKEDNTHFVIQEVALSNAVEKITEVNFVLAQPSTIHVLLDKYFENEDIITLSTIQRGNGRKESINSTHGYHHQHLAPDPEMQHTRPFRTVKFFWSDQFDRMDLYRNFRLSYFL